jgi:hypothetical protein
MPVRRPTSPVPTREKPIWGVNPNPVTPIERMHTELKRSEQGINEFNMRVEGCKYPRQPMMAKELHMYLESLRANIQNLKRAIIWEKQFDDKLHEAGQPPNRHAAKIRQWKEMRDKCKMLYNKYAPMLEPTARAQNLTKRGDEKPFDDDEMEGTPRSLDFDENISPNASE